MSNEQNAEQNPVSADDPLIEKLEDESEDDDETDEMGRQSFPGSDPPSTWAG
jgi:hypothetical protein